ncbi:headcase protein [Agrilus planipennis]|uniref:Headcase protein n=1 Tax=Agrilus planipennis TaxID=224129 RepID=A0A1W4X553_AGRPL|nr:headcase protein [Agrilus planipennis]
MAPRRHHGQVQGLLVGSIDHHHQQLEQLSGLTRCCVPSGECLRAQQQQALLHGGGNNNNDPMLISLDDLRDTVRVTCNNEHCTAGRYMHRECFDSWEQSVLAYLKTCGRARSWSERQRHQNLWTKKGYDLAYKACGCKCARGHLKKDLDWMPPPPTSNIFGRIEEVETSKKKKRRNRNNSRPSLTIAPHHSPNESRGRAGSLSSSTGSSSPPASVSEPSISPIHANSKKKSKFEFSERPRVAGGANGIFTRRLDFSSFNALPPNRLNSYQIKTEDEGNHGNDDTRCFILSTLASQGRNKVHCVLCEEQMLVFDRYPLVDGTFFLSPRQHAKSCIEVKGEGRTQFLTAVCMGCLERAPGRAIRCRFCGQQWDGSSLVLGTMYSYDIFAAMPCCTERIKCNACYKPVLHPTQRLNFFSDYSHMVSCPHCRTVDTHFVKALPYCYSRQQIMQRSLSLWA